MKKMIITGILCAGFTVFGQYAVVDSGTHALLTAMQTQVNTNQINQYSTMLDQLSMIQKEYETMQQQLAQLKQIYDTGTKIYHDTTDLKNFIGDPSKLGYYINDAFICMDTFNQLKNIYDKSVAVNSESPVLSEPVKQTYGDFNYEQYNGVGGIDGQGGYKALQKQIELRENTTQAAAALMTNNAQLLNQIEDLKAQMQSATTETQRQYLLGCIQLLQTNYQITKDNYTLQKDAETGNALAQKAAEESRQKALEQSNYTDALNQFTKSEPLDVDAITAPYILQLSN